MPSKKNARKTRKAPKDVPNAQPPAEMPESLATGILEMVVAKWCGALEPYKEEWLREQGFYDLVFCEHNELIAAERLLREEGAPVPESKTERIAAAKALLSFL